MEHMCGAYVQIKDIDGGGESFEAREKTEARHI